MVESTRQFKRIAQVVVGKQGTGISIVDARIQFEVAKTVQSAPNTGIIRIFNLNSTNEHKIRNEYDEVFLNAGYEGAIKLIFRGNIKHVYRYRDGNDFITEIEAADGDTDFRLATMNKTFAAGTSSAQVIDAAVDSFKGVGDTAKGVIQAPAARHKRGRVVSGNTRKVLDDEARKAGANWSIQDGALQVVSVNAVTPGTAVVITSETGLLGSPEVNDKGIAFKCLLNPMILPNGAVMLDNNSIKAKRQKAQALGKAIEDQKDPVRLDPDGVYKVIKLTHKGDTRGPDWNTEVVCIGLDQPIPKESGK